MGVTWMHGKVSVAGAVTPDWIFYFSKALLVLHEKQGYEDIVPDFSQVDAILENIMAPAAVLCRSKRGVEFYVRLPDNDRLKGLFTNSNRSFLASNADEQLRGDRQGFPRGRSFDTVKSARAYASIFSAARNADCGISTLPNWRIRFLPSFCFSSSFRLREISPP